MRPAKRTLALFAIMCVLAPMGYKAFVVFQIRRHVWDAAEARQAGDFSKAESLSVKLAWWDPDNALPWIMAAENAYDQGAAARAASYLERLPEDDERTPDAMLELANLYFGEVNRPEKGEAALLKAIRINPELGEAHRRLIFYYGITLQRPKMIAQAREAIRRKCDIPETYIYLIGADWITFSNGHDLNQQWAQGAAEKETFRVAQLMHWIGSKGLDEAADFVEDEEKKTRLAEHEQAVRKALADHPHNPELLAYLLKQRAIKGDVDQVIELLGKVRSADGEDNRFWRFKGWLHAANGELKEAEAAYRKALELNPFDWHSQHELAGVLRRLGRFESVERLASLALEGKDLRKTILQLPNVQSAPIPVLERIRDYADACGDSQAARQLGLRVQIMKARASH